MIGLVLTLAGWLTVSLIMATTWSFLYREKRRQRQAQQDREALAAYREMLRARRRALQNGWDDDAR